MNFFFKDLISSRSNQLYFSITCVIVDIPMSSDLIMGLNDIKRMRVFSLLPHLVENHGSEIEPCYEEIRRRRNLRVDLKSIGK